MQHALRASVEKVRSHYDIQVGEALPLEHAANGAERTGRRDDPEGLELAEMRVTARAIAGESETARSCKRLPDLPPTLIAEEPSRDSLR